jgi:formylmethanofuran dehydrogenase subunit C
MRSSNVSGPNGSQAFDVPIRWLSPPQRIIPAHSILGLYCLGPSGDSVPCQSARNRFPPMTLQLKLTTAGSLPIEVFGVTPDHLRGRTLDEIERMPILHGNRTLPLAELFHVSGNAASERCEFSGDLRSVHGIGARMGSGMIVVSGSAGRHLGSQMIGGQIEVAGDVGDSLGAEMRGGLLRVRGSAANLAAAAYRGSVQGMTGGTILVGGSVGDEAGHSMRRGLLAVAGDCGNFLGVNMLAGSLLVLGRCGDHPGAGMRRGTIALLGSQHPALLPTFRPG